MTLDDVDRAVHHYRWSFEKAAENYRWSFERAAENYRAKLLKLLVEGPRR